MIPKIIHYCWFGGNLLPELAQKCIASWKKFLPDYEIKEWNEKNFDFSSNDYVKEAYENKKWAFVTDYVRLWAVFNFGGVYMDTDVEILKPLDEFLKLKTFSGFESSNAIPTGIMAGEKRNHWFELQLDYYKNRHFVKRDGNLDLTTNVTTITNITEENYKISLNNTLQDLGDVVFYPSDYFCPMDYKTGILKLTKNTVAIHHFAGSWLSDEQKEESKIVYAIYKKHKIFGRLIVIARGMKQRFGKMGIKKTISYYFKKYLLHKEIL